MVLALRAVLLVAADWRHPFEVVSSAVGLVVAVLGVAMLIGLVAGQLRKGIVSELRESLTTAATEIDLANKRADRLEAEQKSYHGQMLELEKRLVAMETENRVLRETLRSGISLAPEIVATFAEQLKGHEERSRQMIVAETHELIVAFETWGRIFEERVAERHRRLAEHLPAEIGDALKASLERRSEPT